MSDLSPTAPPSTCRERIGVVALSFVLTAIMTYPTIPHLTTAGRLGTGDGRFSIWNVAWVAHALSTDPANLFNANIFYPAQGTLAYSELNLVAGVMGLPAYVLTASPLAALNSAVAVALMLSFVLMWSLVRRLTGSSAAGVFAATAFTFCPYVSARTAHIQLLMVFVFPLVLLAFLRVVERPTVWRGVGLGAAVGIAALACGYYGLHLLLVLGVLVPVFMSRRLEFWRAMAAGAFAAALVVLPVLVPYFAIRQSAGAGSRGWDPESWSHYSASLRAYVTSGAESHRWWVEALPPAATQGKAFEVLFPGIMVLLAGTVGLVLAFRLKGAARRWGVASLVIAVGGVWASFGPDAGLYTAIAAVPGMDMTRVPARFGVLLPLGLAIGSGFAVATWTRGRVWLGILLVVCTAAELRAKWPLDELPPMSAVYGVLAKQPYGAVIEYPFPYRSTDFHNHTKAMFNSAFHWRPLVNGYSDFVPNAFQALAVPVNAFPDVASFELLKSLNVRYVIWRVSEYSDAARQVLTARFPPFSAHLRLLLEDQDVWLYEIVSWPDGPRP